MSFYKNFDPRKQAVFSDIIEDYGFKRMEYSMTQGGILVAVVGVVLGSIFSQSCSQEIIGKLLPVIAALPGVITAWIGRYRAGGVTLAGFKPPK